MSSSSPERATEKQRAKREAVVTEEKGKQFPKNGKLTFSGLLFPRKQTEKILRLPCQKRGSFGKIAACNGCSFKQNCLREKAAKPGEDARRPGGPSETGQGRRGPGVTLTRLAPTAHLPAEEAMAGGHEDPLTLGFSPRDLPQSPNEQSHGSKPQGGGAAATWRSQGQAWGPVRAGNLGPTPAPAAAASRAPRRPSGASDESRCGLAAGTRVLPSPTSCRLPASRPHLHGLSKH